MVPIFLAFSLQIHTRLKIFEVVPTGVQVGFSFYYVVMLICIVIYNAILWIYMVAWITLLVLPFMTLHALLYDAYVQFNWVNFLPYI